MNILKRIIKITGLIFFIALASFGIGITGVAPTIPISRRDNIFEAQTELVEKRESEGFEETKEELE